VWVNGRRTCSCGSGLKKTALKDCIVDRLFSWVDVARNYSAAAGLGRTTEPCWTERVCHPVRLRTVTMREQAVFRSQDDDI
jgi:hypothetical protein